MRSKRRSAPILFLTVALVAACGSQNPPGPGSTWAIEAVDRAGAFGTITIDRGDVVDIPAELLRNMAMPVNGATRAILIHVEYEPDRAHNSGIGAIDWGASAGDDNAGLAAAQLRVIWPAPDLGWPVEPNLDTQLPGVRQQLAGWLAIAVTEAELRGPVMLRYQPLLEDLGNGAAAPRLVTEVVIHDP